MATFYSEFTTFTATNIDFGLADNSTPIFYVILNALQSAHAHVSTPIEHGRENIKNIMCVCVCQGAHRIKYDRIYMCMCLRKIYLFDYSHRFILE